MRLWHEDLLDKLPKQWLMGQHREICGLKGKGWGKPHSTVNYVFEHPFSDLHRYHMLVMKKLVKLGVKIDPAWYSSDYRGKTLGYHSIRTGFTGGVGRRYSEHNDEYLKECIDNLKEKGIEIK